MSDGFYGSGLKAAQSAGRVTRKRRWVSGTLARKSLPQPDWETPAHFPTQPLVCSPCLSHVPCLCPIANFLRSVCGGALGLFLPTLVFLP